MTKFSFSILAVALALPLAAQAGNAHDHAHQKKSQNQTTQCPPGLAKKSPACLPPGQTRISGHDYVGHQLSGDYVIVTSPERYGLDPRYSYAWKDGHIFRLDGDTMMVLALIGAATAILN
jgi:hypothetical protein